MHKINLKRVIVNVTILVMIAFLTPIQASASWFKDSNVNYITPEQAKNLILKEDGKHVACILNEEVKNNTNVKFIFDSNITMDQIDMIKSQWSIPEIEKLYSFDIYNDYWEIEHYYVGIESKKVYRTGNQGGMTIYVIENDSIVEQYPWIA